MPTSVITVQSLSKSFRLSVADPTRSWLANFLRPTQKTIQAVSNISFSVSPGERIAFIGPNGAGKSTTIKMLTGIIYPTDGQISVFGLDPTRDRQKLAYQIGTVFGQRSQLFPNLPLLDSLEFFGAMYDMQPAPLKVRIGELIELFELSGFSDQPVRKLSLGQRMRAEIAAALIHRPPLILLDEPTIGLDVVAKKSLRGLLLRLNATEKTTIFLTSHDVGDIETLCDRTIIINHGTIVHDLPTSDLSRIFVREKYIDLIINEPIPSLPNMPAGMQIIDHQAHKITLAVDIQMLSLQTALQHLLVLPGIEDLNIYNADLETIIRNIYAQNTTR